jgi:hypothetical protein
MMTSMGLAGYRIATREGRGWGVKVDFCKAVCKSVICWSILAGKKLATVMNIVKYSYNNINTNWFCPSGHSKQKKNNLVCGEGFPA